MRPPRKIRKLVQVCIACQLANLHTQIQMLSQNIDIMRTGGQEQRAVFNVLKSTSFRHFSHLSLDDAHRHTLHVVSEIAKHHIPWSGAVRFNLLVQAENHTAGIERPARFPKKSGPPIMAKSMIEEQRIRS